MPNRADYHILSAWVKAAYLQERFNFAPYLGFVGPPNTGKTRALETLAALLGEDRVVRTATISMAAIYRVVEAKHPILLIDEGNRTTFSEPIVTILNAGQKRGTKAIRTVKHVSPSGEETYEVKEFDCFGFKAYAALYEQERSLTSRAITFCMMKPPHQYPTQIDLKKAAEIREHIAVWAKLYLEKNEQGYVKNSLTLRLDATMVGLWSCFYLCCKSAMMYKGQDWLP